MKTIKMQTFLPYSDFSKSAKCLDNKRLGKQRVETWTIYKTLQKIIQRRIALGEINKGKFSDYDYLIGKKIPWAKHPIVKMWGGYEQCLLGYGLAVCLEWIKRGFKDNMLKRFNEEYKKYPLMKKENYPPWLGNKEFHDSHKSNLLRKNPEWYKQFNWNVPDNLIYVWIK